MFKKVIAIIALMLIVPTVALAAVIFNADTQLALNGTAATVWAMGTTTIVAGNSEADTVTLNQAASPELQVSLVPNNKAFRVGVGATPVTLLEVSPSGSTLNFSIDSSDILPKTGGYYLGQWKMTAGAAATTMSMKIQAEKANTTYWLVVDGGNYTTNTSDGSAIISFSYLASNTSEHTFSLTQFTGGGGGGGGGGISIPPPPTITINNGAAETNSRDVTLTLSLTGATQMIIGNDANFTGQSWESYNTTKAWTLTAGDGLKTVYAMFKDNIGTTTSIVSDTITLSTIIPDTTPPSNLSLAIAGGAAETTSQSVILTIGATEAAEMMISNSSDFAGATWEAYNTSKTWILTEGYGTKTVYIKFRDSAGNISAVVSDTINYVAPTVVTPAPAPAPTEVVTTPEDLSTILNTFSLTQDTAAETKYSPLVSSDLKEFNVTATAEQTTAILNFVVYGISNATIKLGSGERRALIRDYLETVVRPDVVWTDIERMTNGQKPIKRNLQKEQAQLGQVLATFETLVGHRPNFKNAKEDLAWNTMMYRIRFSRDLAKEREGIAKFRAAFGRLPTTPLAWATVRAWAYALR